MASLGGNLLACCGRPISPTVSLSGSHLADRSFSFKPKKPNSWLPASKSRTPREKIQFRQRIRAETSGEILRPLTYVDRHSSWGDTFCSYVWNDQIAEEYAKEIRPLKEEVRAMILAETHSEQEKIHLIDILERLGISYHYEKEIDEKLENIFNLISGSEDKNQYDLCNAALLFRIMRQHGFDISTEIFKKFKDNNGKFREELSNDPKGLLSLYEAIFLKRHGDDILEDALSFTKSYLQKISSQLSSAIQKQVNHALVQPLHRGYARTEAYYNINFYEEDESRDGTLLKFAKMDFNLLQMLHKKELSSLIRWWKPIIVNFDYARDRMVECYYSALGQYFEPQYSMVRIMLAKCLTLDSLIDDTFDAYGTLEELKLFTNAVERWNYEEIDCLPDYMKILYETLLNLHQEYDEEPKKQRRSFALDYWKEGDDKARGQLTNGIECYMKQYKVSKEEAIADFHIMIEDAWKDINEEVCRSSKILMFVFRMALNYTRIVEVFYRNDLNHYTHVEDLLKPQITSLLVNPFNIYDVNI